MVFVFWNKTKEASCFLDDASFVKFNLCYVYHFLWQKWVFFLKKSLLY